MFWRVATTETVTSLDPCYCSLVSSAWCVLCVGAIVFICFFMDISPSSQWTFCTNKYMTWLLKSGFIIASWRWFSSDSRWSTKKICKVDFKDSVLIWWVWSWLWGETAFAKKIKKEPWPCERKSCWWAWLLTRNFWVFWTVLSFFLWWAKSVFQAFLSLQLFVWSDAL